MQDEKFVFFNDIKEKKITARNAKYRRTHSGKGGAVKLPYDYMTRKEKEAMNGEVISYRINSPMSWKEFKALPDDIKVTYIKALREKFGVSDTKIAKMLGTSQGTMSREIQRIGLAVGKHPQKMTKFEKDEWFAWRNGTVPAVSEDVVEPDTEEALPIEEEAKEICKLATMTAKDREIIKQTLGRIEGVAYCLGCKFADPLFDAVKTISEILDREEVQE